MNKKKADQSVKVFQRDKLKASLNIKQLNWTEKQKQFIELATDKNAKIILINGPAGTSKTLLSIYCSLLLLNEKKVSDIIYVRSAVESSESKIGYLPGDVDEKLQFYNLPFADKLDELLNKEDIELLQKQNRVAMFPINYSRGMSWNTKSIILDEAQNSSFKEIVTVMTRLGEFSRCFILADPSQTDLPNSKSGGFDKLFNAFNDEESRQNGIFTFSFDEEDIVRSKLVKFIVKKLKST